MDSFPWLVAVLAGAVVLGAVLVYGILRSRRASARQRMGAERGAHDLYHKDESKDDPSEHFPKR